MNLIIRMMPGPAGPYPAEPGRGVVERGRYLVTAASCGDCHSPMDDRGTPLPGREFSGGNEFPTGDGWMARTTNITPDSVTGIGVWSRERFVGAFKARRSGGASVPGARLSPMPWLAYSGMTEEDLAVIYDYLRTVPPVRNAVVRFVPLEPSTGE